MRHPSKKNNVARLRAFLNRREKFDQARFADLIGCSVHTVQSIETGRLKLSEELAARIALETGVSSRWLMENKLKARIVAEPSRGRTGGFVLDPSYTFECFEEAQASKIKPDEYEAEWRSLFHLYHFAPTLRAILSSAHKRRRLNSAVSRVSKFLSECRVQFGFDERMWVQHERERSAAELASELWEKAKKRPRRRSARKRLR